MSAPAKRAASRKSGGGSRASRNGKPATFEFRGVELKTPKSLPGYWSKRLTKIALLGQQGRGGDAELVAYGFLEDLLGEGELDKIDPVIKGPEDDWQSDLLTIILKLHGVNLGEA